MARTATAARTPNAAAGAARRGFENPVARRTTNSESAASREYTASTATNSATGRTAGSTDGVINAVNARNVAGGRARSTISSMKRSDWVSQTTAVRHSAAAAKGPASRPAIYRNWRRIRSPRGGVAGRGRAGPPRFARGSINEPGFAANPSGIYLPGLERPPRAAPPA